MTMAIGINGLGRIGRLFLRRAVQAGLPVKHLNDISPPSLVAHLLKHDSTHGRWDEAPVFSAGDALGDFAFTRKQEPGKIPWKDAGVTHVLESSGKFRKRTDAARHLQAGAKRVIISAPSATADETLVLGVNDEVLQKDWQVLSNASCTTNAVAPVLKVLHREFGVSMAHLNTVHCYTSSQNLQDGFNKNFRRARAAAASMIPTTTNAAEALGMVLPELDGRFRAMAVRVPVLDVSLIDLVVQVDKDTDTGTLLEVFRAAAAEQLKGILGVCEEELVSVDFLGDDRSVIIDAPMTSAEGKWIRVVGFYDNEMGYVHRLVDVFSRLQEGN